MDDAGLREQGLNKTDFEIVPWQFVSDVFRSGAVKRQLLQILRRIFFSHFCIEKRHTFRIGIGVFELLINGKCYRRDSLELTGPINFRMARDDLLNQGGAGSRHAQYEYG